ncbi:predicted protein [Sclerotinia sclerotiorum 1980 UF-70]|uniref:Uncharacterized protein n=1 Tax=Sclerotinia sclerotiorum (strain ATCC 18683 / 1980 / Ss-1) TaxID=665079 RepID=A7ENT3_SCLS1|nr:predicted protein [Sclerotinia sclerotiorum 1980 UF-70]EDO04499.1 predicted protein [Sclerotinia sclerotiorum 1980 UF-70]
MPLESWGKVRILATKGPQLDTKSMKLVQFLGEE